MRPLILLLLVGCAGDSPSRNRDTGAVPGLTFLEACAEASDFVETHRVQLSPGVLACANTVVGCEDLRTAHDFALIDVVFTTEDDGAVSAGTDRCFQDPSQELVVACRFDEFDQGYRFAGDCSK